MRVLIVEDNPVQQSSLEQYLRSRGCWTDTTASAAVALQRLKVSVPDAVVADYFLADATRVSLLADIRQRPGCDKLPVVVVSAVAPGPERDEIERQAAALPPARFLPKPYEMAALFGTLCELTGKLGKKG